MLESGIQVISFWVMLTLDRPLSVKRSTREFLRITREECSNGLPYGWRFEAGWFRRASGLEWAWFGRDVDESEENPTCK